MNLISNGQGREVLTTRNHPFYVREKGFLPAGGLAVGNAIVTRAGPEVVVTSVKWLRRAEGYTVYNFEVEEDHTYFVGTANGGVWVHNPVCPGQAGRFGDLDNAGVSHDDLTPHHMPQAALGFTSREDGAAIVLPHTEHIDTRTYGWRGRVTAQADADDSFRDVLARDIRDLRAISKKHHGDSRHYNSGIQDLLGYYRNNFSNLIDRP